MLKHFPIEFVPEDFLPSVQGRWQRTKILQDLARLENIEKLTPPGTRVAPKGNGRPRRSLKSP